jgi:hypothetical protein
VLQIESSHLVFLAMDRGVYPPVAVSPHGGGGGGDVVVIVVVVVVIARTRK